VLGKLKDGRQKRRGKCRKILGINYHPERVHPRCKNDREQRLAVSVSFVYQERRKWEGENKTVIQPHRNSTPGSEGEGGGHHRSPPQQHVKIKKRCDSAKNKTLVSAIIWRSFRHLVRKGKSGGEESRIFLLHSLGDGGGLSRGKKEEVICLNLEDAGIRT